MAEVHVRPAREADAAEVARVQLSTWRTAFVDVIPVAVLEGLTADAVTDQWRTAIVEPPTTRHHVLVAVENESVVGFAAAGPATPDDLAGPGYDSAADNPDVLGALEALAAEPTTLGLSTLLVEPRWGRRGHGSRLLAAVIDLATADGFTAALAWTLDADRATRSFLESAGWAADGVGRILDMDGVNVPEVRFATTLTADPE